MPDFSIVVVVGVVAVSVVVSFGAYVLGWLWSMGYHRGKRAFVDRMVKDHCKSEE